MCELKAEGQKRLALTDYMNKAPIYLLPGKRKDTKSIEIITMNAWLKALHKAKSYIMARNE